MGTRADYYVGRGESAEWLGSTAWDGYPDGIEESVRAATTEAAFRAAVSEHRSKREDWTAPERGWPWPWDDSATTDYAYAFDGGKVWASCFGHAWFDPMVKQEEDSADGDKSAVFPNMKARQNVRFDRGSGLIIMEASRG